MILRPLRVVVALAVIALSSGIPQVVAAALGEDCCTEPCDGFDGERCPPSCPPCPTGVCGRAHASLGAVVATPVIPQPIVTHANVIDQATPELPLVVSGLFRPPIA